MSAPEPTNDPVSAALLLAGKVVRGGRREAPRSVDRLLQSLHALDPLAFIDFDARSRGWSSGFGAGEISSLRSLTSGARRRAWSVLALTSADGFERERAVRECVVDDRSAAALLVLRCSDWVDEVRAVALRRASEIPSSVLLELLPLVEHIVSDRVRARHLEPIVDARLDSADLRLATASPDPRVRRGAWRRLLQRGASGAGEWREHAARDPDIRVRALAAEVLLAGDAAERKRDADVFLHDPIGWLAGRALSVLVEEVGDAAVRDALLARTSTLRRRARDWAAIRDVDARAVYRKRLEIEPDDVAALVGIAEIAKIGDEDLVRRIVDDRRAKVRAAGIRALARLQPAAGRSAALRELEAGGSGRAARAAARVLADSALTPEEVSSLEAMALDERRRDGARLRALAVLRRSRWAHLSTLLKWRSSEAGDARAHLDVELDVWLKLASRAARGPDPGRRARIESGLTSLDENRRRSIEFVLRTTSA